MFSEVNMELLLQIWLSNMVLFISVMVFVVIKYDRYKDIPVWGRACIKTSYYLAIALLIALALGKIWA